MRAMTRRGSSHSRSRKTIGLRGLGLGLGLATAVLVACAPVEESSHDAVAPGAAVDISPARPAESAEVTRPAATRHEVAVDGHPIAVWEKRPGSARPLAGVFVLVHGRTWSGLPDFDLQVPGERRSLMDALVERGYATYAVDLRGYGGTPRDDTGWLTPDRAARDLAGVLEWTQQREAGLGAGARGPATVLGWSMGSLVSQLCAQRRPELFREVVLFGYPRDPDRRYKPTPAETKPERRTNTAEAAASDFITKDVISPAAIKAYVDMSLKADPVRVDWRDQDQFHELSPEALNVPTLLIHGARDPYAGLKSQAKLFRRIGHPDRAWVVIPGGDHAVHLEDTMNRFVDAVLDFVERPRAPRRGGGLEP